VLGVVYVWRAMQKAFFAGDSAMDGTHAPHPHEPIPPITLPEKLGAVILLAASITVGVYPQFLLRVIQPALNSPLFAALHNGGWQ
jgi:NADH-quinone oxidoreductase subunit M